MAIPPRVALYDRLPEIHLIEDAKQAPSEPLRALLALVEEQFSAIHENIESLYHDLFVDTCDDWAIPYLADLLGTSHLHGDPITVRRDVAGTIGWRRRKGTLDVIESITASLTGWGVHAAELFKDLAWAQDLDHQRPDAGGLPPYSLATVDRHTTARGGTSVIRDPPTLALLETPFDPFARLPDFRIPRGGDVRPNLQNLAIFLWRLTPYRVGPCRPVHRGTEETGLAAPSAAWVVRLDVHPLGEPVQLFNLGALEPGDLPIGAGPDLKPGPIHPSRLDGMRPPLHRGDVPPSAPGIGDLWFDTVHAAWHEFDGTGWNELDELIVDELAGGASGRPEAYVAVGSYDPVSGEPSRTSQLALELHLPDGPFSPFAPSDWRMRGASLMAWERGLRQPLATREIAIDPRIGRIVIGVQTEDQADALRDALRTVFTYGAVGPVGAHPVDRQPAEPATRTAGGPDGTTLADALADLHAAAADVVVEIADDALHRLDFGAIAGTVAELGGPTLVLANSLTIRAADGRRPVVALSAPLRARALDAERAGAIELRLEGVQLARGDGWTAGDALVSRADMGSLVLEGCTLDPGGAFGICDAEGRGPIHPGVRLRDADAELMIGETDVHVRRTITGPLRIDRGYRLFVRESIIDAGSGVAEDAAAAGYAISAAAEPPQAGFGPQLDVQAATFFGRVRVERAGGYGGIWTQPLEVLDNQTGCIKFSYFTGGGNRLPQTHACVRAEGDAPAALRFESEAFGRPQYGQLAAESDVRIRERGPGDDEMGAFGFLLTAHKWHNIEIRYREFLPLGIRPLLVAVT